MLYASIIAILTTLLVLAAALVRALLRRMKEYQTAASAAVERQEILRELGFRMYNELASIRDEQELEQSRAMAPVANERDFYKAKARQTEKDMRSLQRLNHQMKDALTKLIADTKKQLHEHKNYTRLTSETIQIVVPSVNALTNSISEMKMQIHNLLKSLKPLLNEASQSQLYLMQLQTASSDARTSLATLEQSQAYLMENLEVLNAIFKPKASQDVLKSDICQAKQKDNLDANNPGFLMFTMFQAYLKENSEVFSSSSRIRSSTAILKSTMCQTDLMEDVQTASPKSGSFPPDMLKSTMCQTTMVEDDLVFQNDERCTKSPLGPLSSNRSQYGSFRNVKPPKVRYSSRPTPFTLKSAPFQKDIVEVPSDIASPLPVEPEAAPSQKDLTMDFSIPNWSSPAMPGTSRDLKRKRLNFISSLKRKLSGLRTFSPQ